MAFEGLADRLQSTIQKIRGKGKVTEADVKEMMREVRLALLEADVNFKVVKEFVKKVSERSVGQEVMKSLTPGQQVIKVVKEELTELMGGEQSKIAVSNRPPIDYYDGWAPRSRKNDDYWKTSELVKKEI